MPTTRRSAAQASMALRISRNVSYVNALSFSGRFNVSTATGSSMVSSMSR